MSSRIPSSCSLIFLSLLGCNSDLLGMGPCGADGCADLAAPADDAAAPPPRDMALVMHAVSFGPAPGSVAFDPRANSSTGVALDKDKNVGLDNGGASQSSQPFIWIANSGAGTESKIDTRTHTQLARYCTAPGCNGDPSRTTVGLSGNVVVANRASYFYGGTAHPERASAVGIAGTLESCVDRNNNGKIDTFTGTGDIPAEFLWPAGQAQSPDECVLWYTPLTKDRNANTVGGAGTLPRAAAYDAVFDNASGTLKEYVYIGLYGTQEVVRLDGKTGQIVKYIAVPGNAPYGAVMDKNGSLWVRNSGNAFGLSRIDVRQGDAVDSNYPASPCPYGITADPRGYIYTAGSSCIARLDPTSRTWEKAAATTMGSGRGIGIDSRLHAWAADTSNGLYEFDVSAAFGGGMTLVKQITLPPGVGSNFYYLGIGIDLDGIPWIVSMNSSNLTTCSGQKSNVYKVDPKSYAVTSVETGTCSYTYSDMTGSQLRIAGAPTGVYNQLVPSECGAQQTAWDTLDWRLDTPAGTSVTISLRTGATLQALRAAPFKMLTIEPGGSVPPVSLRTLPGDNFLEVGFAMKAPDVYSTPLLKSVALTYHCQWGSLP